MYQAIPMFPPRPPALKRLRLCPDFPYTEVRATDLRPPLPPPPSKYEVTITEQSGTDLVDYSVLLVVSNDPTFFNDFQNDHTYMEVYDSDKTTLLSFWVEEWDTTNYNAKIWIKIPSIPANSTKKIYLKVNPQRTEPLSNPEATFLFYEHFDDPGTLGTKWTRVRNKGNHEVSGSTLHLWVKGTGSWTAEGWETVDSFGSKLPILVEFRAKLEDPGSKAAGEWLSVSTNGGSWDNRTQYGQFKVDYSPHGLFAYTKNTSASLGSIPTEYKVYKIIFYSNKAEFYINDVLKSTNSDSFNVTMRPALIVSAMTSGYTMDLYVDYVIARHYISPEPSVSYTRL